MVVQVATELRLALGDEASDVPLDTLYVAYRLLRRRRIYMLLVLLWSRWKRRVPRMWIRLCLKAVSQKVRRSA